ncbi:phospholipase D-like domain-containing protein [Pseudomonas sp. S2_H10]
MELKAHFYNIHKVIIDYLEKSESDIVAAVAWFTDKDIFEVLCKKARAGVKVSVVLIGDEINQGPGGLTFGKLRNIGGKVILLPPGSRDEPTMHHKFCVIDGTTVITGSYNWSHKARTNDENITVVTDSAKFASDYLDIFNSLLARAGFSAPVVADADAARRRLEMIRNLVLLGEQSDVATHLSKLRPVAEALQITRIITALDQGEYRGALEEIEAHLRRATALVLAGSTDNPQLRFLLETLELRLESLTDEKAELERSLITFNRRHDDALGDLIQLVLKARAKLARLIAGAPKTENERDKAEASADEAEETYQEYSRQHEAIQLADPLPQLDEDDERELKSLYRKACSLCHPDKVPEEKKQAAHNVFVELQAAYQASDLARVREILEVLLAGGLPGTRSSTLNEAEALKAAIAEMEHAISKLVAELKALRESEAARLIAAAGSSEADWQRFFEQQKEALEIELARLVAATLTEDTEAF